MTRMTRLSLTGVLALTVTFGLAPTDAFAAGSGSSRYSGGGSSRSAGSSRSRTRSTRTPSRTTRRSAAPSTRSQGVSFSGRTRSDRGAATGSPQFESRVQQQRLQLRSGDRKALTAALTGSDPVQRVAALREADQQKFRFNQAWVTDELRKSRNEDVSRELKGLLQRIKSKAPVTPAR